jgi:3-keto-5-aminohexanoate cleavage enzyme
MITATPNICWLQPDVPYPQTTDELVEEARLCEQAGARILHMHAEDWPAWIRAVRDETDLIVQCGMSSLPIDERMDIFHARADLISTIVSHHDEAFAGQDFHVLHPREELLEYARLSREHGTRLEFEVWHTGSIWNLNWLREREAIDPPYFTSVFFGWPGGTWTPPTVEEYLYRRRYMPEGCVLTLSVMDPAQRTLLAAAISHGDHIRVGTEDYPLDRSGQVAPTHRLVAEAAELAAALGRPLATAEQARELSGVGAGPT